MGAAGREVTVGSRRYRPRLVWTTILGAILIPLALLSSSQTPTTASVSAIKSSALPPRFSQSRTTYPTLTCASAQCRRPRSRDWSHARSHSQASHYAFLPLITHQGLPTPPLYSLTIDPNDLAWLYDHWWTTDTIPAVFSYQDSRYDVQVRFRGGTVRNLPKKSWKIDFPAATPFQGQRELNLNAEYIDRSLLRERLAYDLFQRVGLPASRANYARLEINGGYMGLFVQVEQVDQRFLDRIGWDPNGNLYKGSYGNFELSSDYAAYQASYAKKTNRADSHDDVIAFIEMINHTPATELPAAIAATLDVGTYLDWVAVQILLGNFEWLEKNYYLFHDLKQGWWAFTPWDLDLLLGHNWSWQHDIMDPDISWDNPIDSGTWWSKKADGKWNKLVTEVLRDDGFKFAYCRRLWEFIHDEFAADRMFRRIDAFYNLILPYAEADPFKWGSNADLHDGPDELKTYVTRRLAWLSDRVPAYCPGSGPMPLINELMADNATTLPDEAGEYEPWIELYNPSLVSFDVGGMSLQSVLTGTLLLQWFIPEGTVIPPGGFLLVWADGETGEGPFHTGFRLDVDGGTIALADKAIHGGQVVDQTDYGLLAPDLSLGRLPDGDGAWITFDTATPGWSNLGHPPRITGTAHTPAEPGDGQPVTVTAVVTDEVAAPAVSLHWAAGGLPHVSPMADDGAHGDGAAGDGRYGADLPALSSGEVVTYYVQAQDAAGLVATDPPRAPAAYAIYRYIVGFQPPPLYLNELVAINRDTLDDQAGESDDWFEVYNAGPTAVNMNGMYLTDAIENSTRWQIPSDVIVPPGGHVIFWADAQPAQGPTHVNFKLDGDGERLALYAGSDGYNGLIDEVYYGPQMVDEPWGRYPDGGAIWRHLFPTPGLPNRQPPPTIHDLRQVPQFPLAGQPVDVTALIQDDGAVLSATLYFSVSYPSSVVYPLSLRLQGFQGVPMQSTDDLSYGAQIPPQASGTSVAYYVQARDDLGEVARYPDGAPSVTYGYRVGDAPPPLWINEFLASNATVNQDERGEYEDWVELYNAGMAPLDVGGMYLTDDLSRPTKWRIPAGTSIPAGGFLLIWTDDDETDGPLHAGFKLSRDGEEIGLFDRDAAANALVDSVLFGPQATDVSTGRVPDGGASWTTLDPPTPEGSNQ